MLAIFSTKIQSKVFKAGKFSIIKQKLLLQIQKIRIDSIFSSRDINGSFRMKNHEIKAELSFTPSLPPSLHQQIFAILPCDWVTVDFCGEIIIRRNLQYYWPGWCGGNLRPVADGAQSLSERFPSLLSCFQCECWVEWPSWGISNLVRGFTNKEKYRATVMRSSVVRLQILISIYPSNITH